MSRFSIYAFAVVAVVLLLSSARAQHWTYGKGCAGLKLAWKGTARINSVLFCNLSSPTTFTAGLIAFGYPWPCKAIPRHLCRVQAQTCFACINPVATRPILTDRYGAFSQPIGIPNDRAMIGLALAAQFYLYNPPGKGGWKPGQAWLWASSNPGWAIVRI
jgi:hypothetical protein